MQFSLRNILRKSIKTVIAAGLSVKEEAEAVVREVKEERSKAKAEHALDSFEPPPHHCKGSGCKCLIGGDREYCNEFCRDVETSADIHRCGCGHSECDITKQLGNEPTFDRTTG